MIPQTKKINQLRSAGALAGPGKITLVDDGVDRAGLARVGAPRKCDLGTLVRQKLVRLVGTRQEFGIGIMRHLGSLCRGSGA